MEHLNSCNEVQGWSCHGDSQVDYAYSIEGSDRMSQKVHIKNLGGLQNSFLLMEIPQRKYIETWDSKQRQKDRLCWAHA